jgi:ubiquinone/menaquinone biosynthesis C-methylase UbiE
MDRAQRSGKYLMSTVSVKATVERQFSQVADNYRTSTVHAAGEDLVPMIAAAALTGREQVLDAGSGAGHTALAFAPHVTHVISVDLAEPMLAQGRRLAAERGLSNLDFRQADVELLPFSGPMFDVITTRYSAHHWPHPQHALAEFRRVLRPGGRLLISDIVSFDDFTADTYLQAIELLRDPSHVRDHTVQAWLAMLAAESWRAEVVFTWSLRLDFGDWVKRMATPSASVEMIGRLMDGAPAEVRAALRMELDHCFALPGALIRAEPVG